MPTRRVGTKKLQSLCQHGDPCWQFANIAITETRVGSSPTRLANIRQRDSRVGDLPTWIANIRQHGPRAGEFLTRLAHLRMNAPACRLLPETPCLVVSLFHPFQHSGRLLIELCISTFSATHLRANDTIPILFYLHIRRNTTTA